MMGQGVVALLSLVGSLSGEAASELRTEGQRRPHASGQPQSRHKGDGPWDRALGGANAEGKGGLQARPRKSSPRGGGKPEASGIRKPRELFQQRKVCLRGCLSGLGKRRSLGTVRRGIPVERLSGCTVQTRAGLVVWRKHER